MSDTDAEAASFYKHAAEHVLPGAYDYRRTKAHCRQCATARRLADSLEVSTFPYRNVTSCDGHTHAYRLNDLGRWVSIHDTRIYHTT